MSSGRLFGHQGRIYGQAAIAQLVEEGKTEATPVNTYYLSESEREKYKPIPRKEKGNK